MKKVFYSCVVALSVATALSACTDPYDPGQRAIGGGLAGAGTGAAIGLSPEAAAVQRLAR
jgi:hypothetical protein